MTDLIQIGLSHEADTVVDLLKMSGKFSDGNSVARLAFAYAVYNNYKEKALLFNETVETRWHTGGVDRDRTMKILVQSLYPEIEEPYKFIQNMINVGLIEMKKHFEANGNKTTLSSLITR